MVERVALNALVLLNQINALGATRSICNLGYIFRRVIWAISSV
jgi:hypothetical protein